MNVGGPRGATEVRPDSDARLQALLSSLGDVVFELDENGTYLGIWTADDTLLAAPGASSWGERSVRGSAKRSASDLPELSAMSSRRAARRLVSTA